MDGGTMSQYKLAGDVMDSSKQVTKIAAVTILVGVAFGAGEIRKEYRYSVGPHASVSVTNAYGPISVKSTPGNEVIVTATRHSDKVEVDQTQSGDRVDVLSHLLDGADKDSGRIEYEVLVPPTASVTLHSSNGPLRAEKLRGDLSVEGTTAAINVSDTQDAHVHIKTMDGPVNLSNVNNGHVEITSVAGDVTMTDVNGPLVEVNSNGGKISYNGGFGDGGQYRFMTNTGDIEAFAPTYASIDVSASSMYGQVDNDFPLTPRHSSMAARAGSSFFGTIGKAASSVKLHSFSGKIHFKKRIASN
jgi:DUF4097 and DUF4098 domain-containing protein YvlB